MNKKEDKEFSHSLTIPLPSNLVDLSLNTICIKLIRVIDKLDLKVTKSFYDDENNFCVGEKALFTSSLAIAIILKHHKHSPIL